MIRAFMVRSIVPVLLVLLWLLTGGCSDDPGMASIESDANGYYCDHCKAKMYTERRVFLEDCPKCKENALVTVVGYWCERDRFLTICPQLPSNTGGACEKCGAILKGQMVLPHEEDLLTWGATKVEPQ